MKKLIEEDYAPTDHCMMSISRDRVRNSCRKFKEKPSWWFRRFDRLVRIAKQRDSEFALTADELATHYLYRSGLDQRERREVFRDPTVNGKFNAEA